MDGSGIDDEALFETTMALMRCDGYVVIATDPQTEEVDARGPYDGLLATVEAVHLRGEFDRGGLQDVRVSIVRLHRPV